MHKTFGPLALLGSGETSLAGGRLFESLAERLPRPLRVAVLETPAGFELNSAQVAGRVADFLRTRLQSYQVEVALVPARKRGTPNSPDDETLLAPLAQADLIFMGPGSPTYAIRQLHDSLAWDLVRIRHRLGAALVFASAATIAVGEWALPVYEIYKVGEDVSARPGLGLMHDFGLSVSFIPHWNNTDGGGDLDTSRCFIGLERFQQWHSLLPSDQVVIGLDEHTGLMIDPANEKCLVSGVSSVTLIKPDETRIYPSGGWFPIGQLGQTRCLETHSEGIPLAAWDCYQRLTSRLGQPEVPEQVKAWISERERARQAQDWECSDRLRDQIAGLGWQVEDTPQGQRIFPKPGEPRSNPGGIK